MDGKLRKILTECIREIESGDSSMEDCLQRYPDRAAELRPHLELWSGLNAAAKAEPNLGSQQRGQQRLEAAVSEAEREGGRRMIPFLTPALAKAGAVAVAAVLVIGGAAGASAALGGPDVAGDVLSGIGISNASDTGQEHANQNAFDGADNAGQGINNASETIWEQARERAQERAQEREREQEMEGASDGSGNANQCIHATPEANREQTIQTQEQAQTHEQTQEQTQEPAGEGAFEGPGNAGECIDATPEANWEQTIQTQEQAQTQDEQQAQTQEQTQEPAGEGAFEGPGNGE